MTDDGAVPPRDPLDPLSADGAFYDLWAGWPLPDVVLPEAGRERDIDAFAAGAKAALRILGGADGERLAEALVAGLFLREVAYGRMDPEREGGRAAEATRPSRDDPRRPPDEG